MRNPLLPVVAAFAAGIWAAPHLYLSSSQEVFWISAVLLLALGMFRFNRFNAGFSFALLGFSLCGAFLAAEEHSFLPPQHIQSQAVRRLIRPAEPIVIYGWVKSAPTLRPGGEYIDIKLLGLRQSGRAFPSEGVIRVYYFPSRHGPDRLEIEYGARVAVELKSLRPIRNFMTEGSYDSEAGMKRQGIYFTASISRPENVIRLPGTEGFRWEAVLYRFRSKLLASLDRLYPPAEDSFQRSAILKAMLLGDENWLNPQTASGFQESGTFHLLVVSGLHVGALAFGLMWLSSIFRLSVWVETAIVSGALVAFTFLANARVPAMRATWMILFYLAARLLYRERALLNSIAAAALLLLIIHPSDLRDSGFQLSFGAVLIIAAIAVPIIEWTIAPYRRALAALEQRDMDSKLDPKQAQFRQDVRVLCEYLRGFRQSSARAGRIAAGLAPGLLSAALALAEAAVVIFFLQAGMSLLTVTYFHRVVWSGIAANLLILPITGVLIPLGLFVLAVATLSLRIALPGAKLLGWLVSLLTSAVQWSAHLPRLDRRVPVPPAFVDLLFVLILAAIALAVHRRSIKITWISVIVLVVFGVVLTIAPYSPQLTAGRLEVTALDVGQGDSLFILFPHGHTMLVDGGGVIPINYAPVRMDIGERVVSSFFWSRRIKRIDVVVLTHAHADHLGGLLSVVKNFEVGELWLGSGPTDGGLERLLDAARSKHIPIVTRYSGDHVEIDGVEAEILSPDADWHPKRVSNNDSLVLRLSYGMRHIMLSGDVEARMEKRLVNADFPINSDVLKVGHHGSKTSTTQPFLNRVAPRFGIISVGAQSRFGHPNQEVLERLREAGVDVYRTDLDGSITVSTDGRRIEFTRFRDGIRPWPDFRITPLALAASPR